MKSRKGNLSLLLFLVLSLFIVGKGWSQNVQLPHAQFEGFMATYLNGGDYDLEFIEMYITGVTLSDGSQPGMDPIIDAMVQITTKRNPLGVPGTNFDNATITITKGSTTYLSSTLKNINFTTDGTQWFLNPGLNVNNPDTLNLTNILLNPNGSLYIQDLAAQLGSGDIAGMKMTLDVFDGDITQESFAFVQGLFDGVQAITNTPPVANAGPDVTITTEQVTEYIIQGSATDSDDAYTLTCHWTVDGNSQLETSAGPNGECPLGVSALLLGIGEHTLALEVNDGQTTSLPDAMILTITNSVPNADAGNDIIITSEQKATTIINGIATDFDGNSVTCTWLEGGNVLQVSPAGTGGECPLPLSGLTLPRGIHTLTLEATDGPATSSDEMVLTINNTPPIANAGENITVTSDQIATTAIEGTASDFDLDAITCRWTEGATPLQNWTPAGLGGKCSLSLSSLLFSLGAHTLTFEANDGQATSSNSMTLTINNSAPHAAPGGSGVYEINTPVILPADASDFDGDLLLYEWTDGTDVLCSGDIQSVAGGTEVILPDCVVSNLGLGTHTIYLTVFDGVNPSPDIKSVTVQIVDSSAPTLKPVANKYILWPPNHRMVDIAIAANATDNSGCAVTLSATVTSNEPQFGLNRGDQGPDWTEPVIDQASGMIYLQLRAERSGRGKGRKYTVTITATDCSGNISTAKVKIRVPHDQDNDDRRNEDRDERDRDDRHDRGNCRDDRDD